MYNKDILFQWVICFNSFDGKQPCHRPLIRDYAMFTGCIALIESKVRR